MTTPLTPEDQPTPGESSDDSTGEQPTALESSDGSTGDVAASSPDSGEGAGVEEDTQSEPVDSPAGPVDAGDVSADHNPEFEDHSGETIAEADTDDASAETGASEPESTEPVSQQDEPETSASADTEADTPETTEPADSEPETTPIQSATDLTPAEPEDAEEDELAEQMQWFVLKVTSNRENSVKEKIEFRIRRDGLEEYFGDIVIPVEKSYEKTKTGKKRLVKRKLFPGYMMIQMVLNEDTWYLVRDTKGVGDFTGSAGKPIPMEDHEVQRMLGQEVETPVGTDADGEPNQQTIAVNIPYHRGDTVKINDGGFVGFEGVIIDTDPATGKIQVEVTILGQPTPVELEYYQVEPT